MADTNYASNIEQHIKEGNYKSNGFLRLSGIAPKITSYVSEKTFPSVSGSPVTISAEIVPTGDANPLMFGGWLAQLFYLYTAGVTADVDSPARAETYPTLETYWTSFKSESSQSTGTFEYCSRSQKLNSSPVPLQKNTTFPPRCFGEYFKLSRDMTTQM